MDEHEVVDRLRRFGDQPVDPALSRQVLTSIRTSISSDQHSVQRRRTRRRIAAAAVAGFFAGSLGLASAGALPASLQDTAHSALDRIGVHVPPGHDRFNDPAVCPDAPYKNHGEYVRTHPDDPNAGQSPCGKPTKAVDPDKKADPSDASGAGEDGNDAPGQLDKNKQKKPDTGAPEPSTESSNTESSSTESSTESSSTESSSTESSSTSDQGMSSEPGS